MHKSRRHRPATKEGTGSGLRWYLLSPTICHGGSCTVSDICTSFFPHYFSVSTVHLKYPRWDAVYNDNILLQTGPVPLWQSTILTAWGGDILDLCGMVPTIAPYSYTILPRCPSCCHPMTSHITYVPHSTNPPRYSRTTGTTITSTVVNNVAPRSQLADYWDGLRLSSFGVRQAASCSAWRSVQPCPFSPPANHGTVIPLPTQGIDTQTSTSARISVLRALPLLLVRASRPEHASHRQRLI